MKGEFHTKNKRKDMNTMIRSHHFRFGSTQSTFETTHGATFIVHHSANPSPVRGRQDSSVHLGTDQWEGCSVSRSQYQGNSEYIKRTDRAAKQQNNQHHFDLGLRKMDPEPTSKPKQSIYRPSQMCRPPEKSSIIWGTDKEAGLSITKADYRPYSNSFEVPRRMLEKQARGTLHFGSVQPAYVTTSSAIGKERGSKSSLCEEAQKTYVCLGDAPSTAHRSLSQDQYLPQKVGPKEDSSGHQLFIRSSHFALGNDSDDSSYPSKIPNPVINPSENAPFPHLKKSSIELGNDSTELASSYTSSFQPRIKGDRALIAPWTGCSVSFGGHSDPAASVYQANYSQYSLPQQPLTHSLDLHRHNFQLGNQTDVSYETAAEVIGKDTVRTFAPNTGFTSFSKKAHFTMGNSLTASFDTTTKTDYTFKGGSDRVALPIPAGLQTGLLGEYRTIHQGAFKWVQPVPSS